MQYDPVMGCLLPWCVVMIVTAASALASAQTPDDPLVVGPLECRTAVTKLRNEIRSGRRAGELGCSELAQAIARTFKKLGLQSGGDGRDRSNPWTQRVTLKGAGWSPARTFIGVVGREKQRVSIGSGFSAEAPARMDAKGKLAVLCVPEITKDPALSVAQVLNRPRPRMKKFEIHGSVVIVAPNREGGDEAAHRGCVSKLRKAGAKAVLLVDSKARLGDLCETWTLATRYRRRSNLASPLLYVTRSEAEKLAKSANLELNLIEAQRSVHSALGAGANAFSRSKKSVHVALEYRVRRHHDVNVVGWIGGSDPKLAEEVVVVVSHLDHPVPKLLGITSGDGLTGCAGLVLIAKRLAESKPRRTVVFVGASGEHADSAGARWFAKHPSHPLDKVIGVVALGSVGIADGPLEKRPTALAHSGATALVARVKAWNGDKGLQLVEKPTVGSALEPFNGKQRLLLGLAGVPGGETGRCAVDAEGMAQAVELALRAVTAIANDR